MALRKRHQLFGLQARKRAVHESLHDEASTLWLSGQRYHFGLFFSVRKRGIVYFQPYIRGMRDGEAVEFWAQFQSPRKQLGFIYGGVKLGVFSLSVLVIFLVGSGG